MSGPLRGYYVFKRRALGPHTFGTVVLLVLKKDPAFEISSPYSEHEAHPRRNMFGKLRGVSRDVSAC